MANAPLPVTGPYPDLEPARVTKLLIADADEFSRDLLTRRLERRGFAITVASDGRQALVSAHLHRPDVILMNLDMPVLDGRAAVRLLQNDPSTFRIPIIALAAEPSSESVTEAATLGCQGYQTKPVVLSRLLERIGEILARLERGPAVKLQGRSVPAARAGLDPFP
jgi:CheY-like chemotaxis protein